MSPSMFQTLVSNVTNLIITLVYIDYEISIKLEVILIKRGGIDYPGGGVLDLPSTAEVYAVSVFPPVSTISVASV